MENEIPKEILKKHPEMQSISKALEEYRNNKKITALCPECNKEIIVEDLKEIRSLWVKCPCGKISMHSKYES